MRRGISEVLKTCFPQHKWNERMLNPSFTTAKSQIFLFNVVKDVFKNARKEKGRIVVDVDFSDMPLFVEKRFQAESEAVECELAMVE